MRRNLANNLMAGGVALFLTGMLIIAFSPVNLVVFTRRIAGPTVPVGIVISLVGFGFTAAGGYFKVRM
jgi:hypothetical protein